MTEEVYTKSRKVICSGGNYLEGHPKVYLEIARDSDRIVCPYCSKIFILEHIPL